MSTTQQRNPWAVGKYEGNRHFGYKRAAVVDRISHEDERGVWHSSDGESSVTAVVAYGKAYLVHEGSDGFVTVIEYHTLADAQLAGQQWWDNDDDEEDYR